MWPIKFKPHSRFALPRCNFPKRMLGVFCNFPKQNTPDFYIFPKIFVEELLVWSTPLYDKKCFNCAESIKQSHIPHNCEHIDWYQIPISRKFYTKFCSFQSNITFIWWVFTNYTIHWFEVKYIISSQIDTFISFARKIVSPILCIMLLYCVL